MLILVTGGAASGKSEYAEHLMTQSQIKPRIYLATMQVWDDECRQRIERHRAMRSEKGFCTQECFQNLASAQVPQGSDVLLECMSNLVANEMFGTESPKEHVYENVLLGVSILLKKASRLVVVSNEIFSDGAIYNDATMEYLKTLGKINTALAERAQMVVEVVCGIPVIWKGEEKQCEL